MVNTLDQIDALIERMKLQDHQYAIRVGNDEADRNDKGLTSLCRTKAAKKIAHRYAPVLFTTQQKISKGLMLHQDDFEDMSFFDYCGPATPSEIERLKKETSCGRKRQVRLWDEAFLPIDPVTIGFDEITAFADRLAVLGQVQAATTIKDWLESLRTTKPSHDTVPNWIFALAYSEDNVDNLFKDIADGDEKWKIVSEAMFHLLGKTVKILRQDYNNKTVAISYRRSIPHNIEPLLIFDASGNDALEYNFLAKNKGNVEKLPSASKAYRNLNVRHFDHRSGQAAYRSKDNIEVLATAVAEAVLDKPLGDDVLIVVRKGDKAPATTLPASILAKVRARGGDAKKLHFVTWGAHKATNEFQHIKHVVLAGVHQAPPSTIIAMIYGTSSKPMHALVSRIDIELMRMSRIIGDLNQAIGRGAVRQMTPDGDVSRGCTVDLIASSVGPLGFKDPLNTLGTMFPGATVKAWYPTIPTAKPSMDRLVVDAALALLGDQCEVLVTSSEWADQAGYNARTLQRSANKGVIFTLLDEHGVTARKQGQKWLLSKNAEAAQLRAA